MACYTTDGSAIEYGWYEFNGLTGIGHHNPTLYALDMRTGSNTRQTCNDLTSVGVLSQRRRVYTVMFRRDGRMECLLNKLFN